jgi:hypothetical protein
MSDGGAKPQKVSVVSYPKSGRTWLRVLIGKALCEKFGLDDRLIFDKLELAEATGFRIMYTHEDAGLNDHTPCRELARDKSAYARKKVILLVRDPRDVLVSCYCHVSKRSDAYTQSISEFARSDEYGIAKIVTFYNIWHDSLRVPKELLLLRYEAMHADPRRSLRAVLEFIGASPIEDGIVAKATAYASFGNMKRLEESGHFESKKLRPGDAEDEESYKVRRGLVGGYRDYLGREDARYVEGVIEELGCPLLLESVEAGGGVGR